MYIILMIFIKICYDKIFKNCYLDEFLFVEKFFIFCFNIFNEVKEEIIVLLRCIF